MIDASTIKLIKPCDLPAPPQSSLQVIRACANNQISNTDIATLVSADPALTAELLRIVNSAYFGLNKQVQSIQRAIAILGQQALRNLVLCVAVRDAINKTSQSSIDTDTFWEDCLRHAVSARMLSKQANIDPDDSFTAGLLQDFSLLVMFFLKPTLAPQWPELREQTPDTRYALELTHFQTTHNQVSSTLAEAWSLPEHLGEALSHHHWFNESDRHNASPLCKTLHCADWMAAVYTARDKNAIIEQCHNKLNQCFNINVHEAQELLNNIPQQLTLAANALGLHIKTNLSFEQILREANVKLAEVNLNYQEITWELEKALKQRNELAAELNRELDLAREIQQSLLPQQRDATFPIVAINIPAKQLSGDFYDFYALPDGRIYFNLGDVSGKGVNAALLMAKTNSLFRCMCKHIHEPGELMALLNAEICETSIRGMFVTMVVGLYDPRTGKVKLINAGHPPAIAFRKNGTMDSFEAEAPPLGIIPDADFPEVTVDLQDASLYLFTDGVLEGRLADGKAYGMKRLLKRIIELRRLPPQQRLESIVNELSGQSDKHRDDITLLLVEGSQT